MRKGLFSNRFSKLTSLVGLIIVVFTSVWWYRSCSNSAPDGLKIENTPIQITQIRKIAELTVIGMEDEFVLDTIEYYQSREDQIAGNSFKLRNTKDFSNVLANPHIKRRLTLIVKTRSKFGFDLSKGNLEIFQNNDSVWIHTKPAKILSIESNPSKTKVFIENGSWSDGDRAKLLNRIVKQIQKRLKTNEIQKRVENSFDDLVIKIMKDGRKVLVYHDL